MAVSIRALSLCEIMPPPYQLPDEPPPPNEPPPPENPPPPEKPPLEPEPHDEPELGGMKIHGLPRRRLPGWLDVLAIIRMTMNTMTTIRMIRRMEPPCEVVSG